MNRIVLIGNGFDLAHGLKTRYEDFINWYCDLRVYGFAGNLSDISSDVLCSFQDLRHQVWNVNAHTNGYNLNQAKGKDIVDHIINNKDFFKTTMSPFFENIYKSIETKGWVDIENEYYKLLKKYAIEESAKDNLHELNLQLQYIQSRLTDYLMGCQQGTSIIKDIWDKIYSPIKLSDISIAEQANTHEHIQKWWLTQNDNVLQEKANRYNDETLIEGVKSYKFNLKHNIYNMEYPRLFMLPDVIMLLNFNYTYTADMYSNNMVSFVNHIHGALEKPESIIFGYGDELDDSFKKLLDSNENECLRNVKSIKYQESDNYRNVLAFIESAPYQVCIMGHSCGNSDRTLLNTLFEHKNCLSIKPYYYIKEDGTDNYLDIIQNISRNFTDMKLMRDRVVNKTYCETIM